MNKYNFFGGLAIMVGLIVIGISLPAMIGKMNDGQRIVNVKGLCEREVPADKVIWPIKFKTAGNDLSQVYADIESKNAILADFLKGGGIDESNISISMPTVSDKYTQEYGSNDRTFRYVASSIVTVCTKDVDKVLSLMAKQSQLIRKGIVPDVNDWECKTQFFFEGLNDIKPEMIQEATRNAREVAEKFAADSQSRLGKIKNASQGTFSIESRDSNTPQIKKVRIVTYVDYYLNN